MHKITGKVKGTVLFYDEGTAILYDHDMVPITQTRDYQRSKFGGAIGLYNIASVQFGQFCNLRCTYCLQRTIGSVDSVHTPERGTKIQQTVEYIKRTLDPRIPTKVDLWGGEPLFYWDDLKEVITSLEPHGQMHFTVFTNGMALKEEHLAWFASRPSKFTVSLSHDGYGQAARGKDVLDKVLGLFAHIIAPNIDYSIATTVSNTNHDLLALNDLFMAALDRHGLRDRAKWIIEIPLVFSVKDAFDPRQLHKFTENLRAFLTENERGNPHILNNTLWSTFDLFGIFALLNRFNSKHIPGFYRCHLSYDNAVVVNTNGEVLLCPHSTSPTHVLGSVDGQVKHKSEVIRTGYDPRCDGCLVRDFCRSSCPIIGGTFEDNHKVMWAYFSTLYEFAFKRLLMEDEVVIERV